MGTILLFPSAGAESAPRVLPLGGWLTDARLSSFGFSREDIRAIRQGEPIGGVLARRTSRNSAKLAGSPRQAVEARSGCVDQAARAEQATLLAAHI